MSRIALVTFFSLATSLFAADARVYLGPLGQSEVEAFNTSTSKLLSIFQSGSTGEALVLSKNGQTAYIASQGSNQVLAISLTSGKTTALLPSGLKPSSLALSPDGSTLYILNAQSETLTEINLATNQQIASVPINLRNEYQIAVSPDNTKVFVTNQNNVAVVDVLTSSVSGTIPVPAGRGLVVSPSGTTLYVATQSTTGLVYAVNIATGKISAIVPNTLNTSGFGIAVSPDGAHLYVGTYAGLAVISTATNTITGTIGTQINAVAVTPDGSQAFGTAQQAPQLVRFNLTTNTQTGVIPLEGVGSACVVSADGSKFYALLASASVLDTVDSFTNKQNGIIQNVSANFALVTSGTGNIVAGVNSTQLSVVSTSTHKLAKTIALPPNQSLTSSIAVNSGGTMAFVPIVNPAPAISFIDLSSGSVINSVALPGIPSNQTVFNVISPDDSTVYAYYGNGIPQLCAIDVATAALGACVAVSANAFNIEVFTRALIVSPDSTKVYAMVSDTSLGQFDSKSLQLLQTLTVSASAEALNSLAISPLQNSLYAIDYTLSGGDVYRVDLGTFTITASATVPSNPLDLAITPDGSELFVVGYNNLVVGQFEKGARVDLGSTASSRATISSTFQTWLAIPAFTAGVVLNV